MYQLIIQPNAVEELNTAYQWIRARAPEAAARWFNGFVLMLDQLRTSPESFGLALNLRRQPYPIRELLY